MAQARAYGAINKAKRDPSLLLLGKYPMKNNNMTSDCDQKLLNYTAINEKNTESLVYVSPPRNKSLSRSDSAYLYFSVCVVSLISFSGGVGTSWSSAVIPKLKSINETCFELPVTTLQISLIVSLYDFAQALGPFCFLYVFQRFDTKVALFSMNALFVIGTLILGFSCSAELYYFARFIMGAAFGGSIAVTPIYISEITVDNNRGKFNCLHIALTNLGTVYSFVLGPFLSVKCFNFLCIIPSIFVLVCWKYLPESPYHLLGKGKKDNALIVLKKLYCKSNIDVEQVFKNMQISISQCEKTKTINSGALKSQLFWKIFFVCFGLVIGVPLSGILTMIAFSQEIFIESGSFIIPSELSSIIVGSWLTFCTFFISFYVMEQFRRRTLMLFGSISATFCLCFLTSYFFLKRYWPASIEYIYWIPLIFTILYLACFQCYGAVMWTVLTEIFSPDIKALAISILTSLFLLGIFVSVFFFPIISDFWGMEQSFLVHTIFSFLAAIHIYKFIPETKHQSYEQIKQYFLN